MAKRKLKPRGKPFAKGEDPRRKPLARRGAVEGIPQELPDWYSDEEIPRDQERNLQWREITKKRAKKDKELQKRLLERCRADPVFWVNGFVLQYNPKKKGREKVGPFITFPCQEELLVGEGGILWCVEHQEDLVIEKSREMGASWLMILAALWGWLFGDAVKYHFISRNEALVESADPDSLFWKIDFAFKRLPEWMWPAGWDRKKDRKKKLFRNTATEGTITGEASTGKAGVGGRATAMFVDEFSQIKEDYEVYDRTSDTADCRIFNGTHKGVATCFHDLTQGAARGESLAIHKVVLHWSQHPQKYAGAYRFDPEANQVVLVDKEYQHPPDYEFVRKVAPAGGPFPGLRSPYYDRQCRRKKSPRAVAQDLDIDPGGSVSQFFDAGVVAHLAARCREPFWEGDVVCDADSGRPQGLMRRAGGPLRLWVVPKAEGVMPRGGGVFALGKYGVGVDVATGLGATNSCISVISADSGEKVAEYATCRVRPEHLAPIVVALCWMFKSEDGEGALLCWEDAGPGQTLGQEVMGRGYGHIHYREGSQEFRHTIPTRTPGWFPVPREKRLVLESYRAALECGAVTNHSKEAVKECLAYRYNEQGEPEHPREVRTEDPTEARANHGDRVIADALAWKMVKALGGGEIPGVVQERQPDPVGTLAWRRQLASKHKDDW